MANILVIDDDLMICESIGSVVISMGSQITSALNLKNGLKDISKKSFDVIFLDVRLPDGNGLEALPEIMAASSLPDVIIITGEGDPDGAELAISNGAWDYIQKPLSVESIKLPLLRVLQYRHEKESRRPRIALNREGIIGESPKIKQCLEVLSQTADIDANILIKGETGTGKELFAKAIHKNSRRASGSFVVVDCAALPETLVESMLFGHEKGAYTGADRAREGLVQQADGGTLFLDEVGELPVQLQKAFLRVLQERCFRPVGGKQEVRSDFRLISATNRDLDQMARDGKMRKDFLFRLKTFIIDLPPLRERVEDIDELAMFYMLSFSDRYGIGEKRFSPEFLQTLRGYSWPGNVREFSNAMEEAISMARYESTLFPVHLPNHIRIQLARVTVLKGTSNHASKLSSFLSSENVPKLRDLLGKTESKYLQDLLMVTRGDIQKMCTMSGLSRSRLYDRLKKYDISRDS